MTLTGFVEAGKQYFVFRKGNDIILREVIENFEYQCQMCGEMTTGPDPSRVCDDCNKKLLEMDPSEEE